MKYIIFFATAVGFSAFATTDNNEDLIYNALGGHIPKIEKVAVDYRPSIREVLVTNEILGGKTVIQFEPDGHASSATLRSQERGKSISLRLPNDRQILEEITKRVFDLAKKCPNKTLGGRTVRTIEESQSHQRTLGIFRSLIQSVKSRQDFVDMFESIVMNESGHPMELRLAPPWRGEIKFHYYDNELYGLTININGMSTGSISKDEGLDDLLGIVSPLCDMIRAMPEKVVSADFKPFPREDVSDRAMAIRLVAVLGQEPLTSLTAFNPARGNEAEQKPVVTFKGKSSTLDFFAVIQSASSAHYPTVLSFNLRYKPTRMGKLIGRRPISINAEDISHVSRSPTQEYFEVHLKKQNSPRFVIFFDYIANRVSVFFPPNNKFYSLGAIEMEETTACSLALQASRI